MNLADVKIVTCYFSKVLKLPLDIVPISIAQSQPKGCNLEVCKTFIPSNFCRDLYRQGDWKGYRQEYRRLYNNKLTKEKFVEYLKEKDYSKVALICWEKDFNKCHRSFTAEIINGFKIFHCKVEEFQN